jgi:4-hydroxy-4-methyl-2-oxoglutarate aldolase
MNTRAPPTGPNSTASDPALTPSLIERWRRVPSAVIADVSSGACQIDPAIRPLCAPGHQPKLFGRALTVHCFAADIGAVVQALDIAQPGDVLVIAAQGYRQTAMIGSILGGYLRSRGAVGLVCDGAIRDVEDLATWRDFSVFTRCITPRGPSSFNQGEVNCPVAFGGRRIVPGDIVIGDDDGLVSLTPGEAISLLAAAEAKLELETQWRERLAGGMTIAAALGLATTRSAP